MEFPSHLISSWFCKTDQLHVSYYNNTVCVPMSRFGAYAVYRWPCPLHCHCHFCNVHVPLFWASSYNYIYCYCAIVAWKGCWEETGWMFTSLDTAHRAGSCALFREWQNVIASGKYNTSLHWHHWHQFSWSTLASVHTMDWGWPSTTWDIMVQSVS